MNNSDNKESDKPEEISVEVKYGADFNRGIAYDLKFPLSELANGIALCGWTIVDQMPTEGPIRDEIRRISTLPYLDIPEAQPWFAKYGKRYNFWRNPR